MAMHNVFVVVDYVDAAERTATVTYLWGQEWDDTEPAGLASIVNDIDGTFMTILNTLTWSQIPRYRVCLEMVTGAAGANIASNNQVRAFTRVLLTDGSKGSFEIPAWDDALYDQDSNNLLSTAYNVAAGALPGLLRDPETGLNMSSISFSQSRTRKSRNVLS